MLQPSGTSTLDLPLNSELPVCGGDATHLGVEIHEGIEMVKIDEAQSTSQEKCLQQQQRLGEEEQRCLLQVSQEKQVSYIVYH